jgi:hypothetical protein
MKRLSADFFNNSEPSQNCTRIDERVCGKIFQGAVLNQFYTFVQTNKQTNNFVADHFLVKYLVTKNLHTKYEKHQRILSLHLRVIILLYSHLTYIYDEC